MGDIRWARRIPKSKLRMLYAGYAAGMPDLTLLDDVGILLLMRCQDIVSVEEAKGGLVTCPDCRDAGRDTKIKREFGNSHSRTAEIEVLDCSVCGWHMTWEDYSRSFRRRQLNSGGALDAFKRFVWEYPKAKTSDEKMRLIDGLIHEFHYSLKASPATPTRSVGPNLIDAKLSDVMIFLNELTYGGNLSDDIHKTWQENAREWQQWLTNLNEEQRGNIKGAIDKK